MNIFLPYENDIERSVRSLDDRRLIKQILECKTLLDIACGYRKGYANHPVARHYNAYPHFLTVYGRLCCHEYFDRFGKIHEYNDFFLLSTFKFCPIKAIPFYAEYPATDPRCIRTTENVSELFQQKLIRKWNTDKIKPKWTNRGIPEFYKGEKDSD